MKKYLNEILPEIIQIRHTIHAFPELQFEEHATSKLVAETLRKFGYEVTTGIGGTGVSAVLDSGKPGKTVALRADMDALPIAELTTLSYRSKNDGKMHACGHDGHTATLLAVAGVLIQCKSLFKGKIKFIFQPAEEVGEGAKAMIDAKILEHPKVDAIFCYHNSFQIPAGKIAVKAGCIMAGTDAFTIHINGHGGHAAHLETTIDPIHIGATIILALQSIVSRLTAPHESVVISVTQFHGGTKFNIIPDDTFLNGTIRTLSKESLDQVKAKITNIATGIATTFGATVNISFHNHMTPTMNHERETQLVLNVAENLVGKDSVIVLTTPSMAAEDFSLYLNEIPGCLFFVGNGGLGEIHGPRYQFNDDIISTAASILMQVTIDYLNQH